MAATVEDDDCQVWELGPLIGSGGFGDVYRGVNPITGELVAIKRVKSGKIRSACREVFLLDYVKQVGCEDCVQIVRQCFQTKSNMWIVMEYLGVEDGWMDMRKERQKISELPIITVLGLLIQIGVALDFLHQEGIIHYDLKQANIMINISKEKIKLVDFGGSCIIPKPGKKIPRLDPPCDTQMFEPRCNKKRSSGGFTAMFAPADIEMLVIDKNYQVLLRQTRKLVYLQKKDVYSYVAVCMYQLCLLYGRKGKAIDYLIVYLFGLYQESSQTFPYTSTLPVIEVLEKIVAAIARGDDDNDPDLPGVNSLVELGPDQNFCQYVQFVRKSQLKTLSLSST